MSDLTSVRRYLYWSDRRIRCVAEDNDIRLERKHLSSVGVWDGPLATAIAQGDLGAVGAAFDRHG
jgi:hypothetical protein